MPMADQPNAHAAELAHFGALANRWWDPNGEFRTLHDLNPVRVDLVDRLAGLAGQRVLDVGCGGGLLAEAMARRGARVTGVDLSGESLQVARLHLLDSGVTGVEYREISAEDLARELPGGFQVITCMELLEHVPDPAGLVTACARLVGPGGHVIFSTLNRTTRAFLTAIVGAEYLSRLVPRGTHTYDQFIRPSELDSWARCAGLEMHHLIGGRYHPLTREYSLDAAPTVNYFAHFRAIGGTPDQ